MPHDRTPDPRRPQFKSMRAPSTATSLVRRRQMAVLSQLLTNADRGLPPLVFGDFNNGDTPS